MMASKSASSSENDVSIRQWISGWRDRTSRQTSTPLPSGSRTSSTATSGAVAGMRPSASSAVPASPTTSMSPAALDEVTQAPSHDLMVIEQEHGSRAPFHHAARVGVGLRCPTT